MRGRRPAGAITIVAWAILILLGGIFLSTSLSLSGGWDALVG
jgi:hypothetical protein